MLMNIRRVCVYLEVQMSTNVEYACAFANDKLTKSFIAHITFVRFLVRVNTHVAFQIPD